MSLAQVIAAFAALTWGTIGFSLSLGPVGAARACGLR